MQTLQSKLMLWMGICIAVVLFVSGVVLYLLVQRALLSEFDTNLQQACQSFALLIETDGQRISSDLAEKEFPQFARAKNPDLYQIFDSAGRTIDASTGLGGKSLAFLSATLEQSRIEPVIFPDGRPGRAVSHQLVPKYEPPDDDENEVELGIPVTGYNSQAIDAGVGSPVTLVIARDTMELNRTLQGIRWLIGLVTAIASLIGVLMAAVVARLGLASLRATADQIAAIDGGNLAVRIDPQESPGEVRPMVTALNEMLERLRLAFERERQFSANVAHELRTPLSGIKSIAEVTVSERRDTSEYERSLRKCLEICDQTGAILDNLTTLARVDAGHCQVHSERIDLAHVIRQAWQPFAKLAEQRGLSVAWNMDESLQVQTDPSKLALVFRNVFDNAVSYADAGTRIEMSCQPDRVRGMIAIKIANLATGFANADTDHLFERFWRGDKSRSQTGRHSGLGLPLCRSLVQLLGGRISTTLSDDHQFTIEVQLPANSS